MPGNEILRVAIVGLGVISKEMAPALSSIPSLQVVGVIDKNTEAVNSALEIWLDAEPFTELSGCLQNLDIDAVIVNTPAISHLTDVELILKSGRHCLVAKPLTPHLEDARALVNLAKDVGRTLAVAEQIRYNDHFQMVRKLIAEEVIGRVESVILLNSKPRPNVGSLGNSRNITLEEMATHHFDILLSLLGNSGEVKVYCDEFNPSWSRYPGGGMVNAVLTFSNQIHVMYQGGVCAQAPMYELRLEGSKGALRCRGSHMSYGNMVYELSGPEGVFEKMDIHAAPGDSDPWLKFLSDWIAYVNNGDEPPFSGRHNLRVLQLVEAARRSVAKGSVIIVPNADECETL